MYDKPKVQLIETQKNKVKMKWDHLLTRGRESKAAASVTASRKSSHSFGSRRTIGANSRSNLFASTSRKSVVIDSSRPDKSHSKPLVQVFDDFGQDVTPRSLLAVDPTVKRNQSHTFFDPSSSIATPSEVSQSFYAASTASMYGGFSRSVFGSVSGRSSPESISEELAEPSSYHDKFSSSIAEIRTQPTFMKEELTEEDLEKQVHLTLTETDTIWLLDLPGTYVAEDHEFAIEEKEKIQKYEELLKNRAGNDMYVERGMQTFNDAPKSKEVQTSKVELFDVGCMATTWDMYDTLTSQATGAEADKIDSYEKLESLSRPASGERASSYGDSDSVGTGSIRPASAASESVTGSRASMFTMKSASLEEMPAGEEKDSDKNAEEIADAIKERILGSDSMKSNLFLMERAIAQNIYQPRQAQYRALDVVKDIDAEKEEESASVTLAELGPRLNKLWSYSCSLTKGNNVSCMAWNKKNLDILAVGYGEFSYSGQKGGLACCWSIKNPEYPERVFHVNSGVTALDFSAAHPNLLAVGLYDGTIAIYNVRSPEDSPALDSFESQGKHTSPVWQLQWVDRDHGTGEEIDEILVSISADGRVTKWSIRKGFECADLIKLKRINVTKQTTKGGGAGGTTGRKSDALISRFSAGFCFDFNPKDSNIYLAGTEEGHVHKCSCSYNEQFLESFLGHTGPIYKVRWSPLCDDAFITCSADWSIRLWHQDKTQSVMTFLSSTKSVNDICWSPVCATLFACVTDRAIEIWDLKANILDPIISYVPVQNFKLSNVIFSLNTSIQTILVGDSEGQVTVYQLLGTSQGTDSEVSFLRKLLTFINQSSPPTKQNEEEQVDDGFD
ncbi:WD repeat-containing protein 78-like isoform X2 [Actinia tenebrosa]|uniref:Dynein axonemal intermediate chain 4 n=1 Tax=Actinia tenebrosa TaxID=6105 RepID=A0A6P8ISD6_ACTTE|nr:WD repeat-containing protein 78-like isoform X2 [Actinia tenebrosa]